MISMLRLPRGQAPLICALLLASVGSAQARLEILPTTVSLESQRDFQGIVVLEHSASGAIVDRTHDVGQHIVRLRNIVARPASGIRHHAVRQVSNGLERSGFQQGPVVWNDIRVS